jgi:hypothetical protein
MRALVAVPLLAVLPACSQGSLSVHMPAPDGATGAGTGGSAGGASACSPGVPLDQVTGTIGGDSFTLNPESSSSAGTSTQSGWSILRAASEDDALFTWGEGAPDGGSQSIAGGVLVLPHASPPGATYYCAAQVDAEPTSAAPSSKVAITLSQLSVLGQCSGAPQVSGDVQLCTDYGPVTDGGVRSSCAQGFGVSGTIEGTVITIDHFSGTILTAAGSPPLQFNVIGAGSSEGAIVVDSHADGSATGWLRLPDGSDPNAGAIYCLGDGRATELAPFAYSVTFQTYGRLGQCPGTPIDGQVNLCR